ncbi:MAG: TIGR04086 family membrane protein [Clostridia bacterium]|nr:TIGR04086 family membrane protein [Clostridia bacterium]
MKKNRSLFALISGVLLSVGITVAAVALLALFAKDVNSSGTLISALAIAIKVISIVAGVIFASVKIRSKGWLVGLIIGAVYWCICLGLSSFNGGEAFSLNMLLDALLTCAIGVFAGILTVNALK